MILAAASSVGTRSRLRRLSAAFNPRPVHAVARARRFTIPRASYDTGPHRASERLQSFEAEIAAALGKEKALFFPTGVVAQNAALHAADLPAARSADFTTPRPAS